MATAAIMLPTSSTISSPIDSGARYDPNQHEKHEPVDIDGTTSPELFLVKKMTTVLNTMGYSETAQRKVMGLVVANTVDATVTVGPEEAKSEAGIDSSVGVALSQALLDEKTMQQKGLRLNSNEPVLLVEGSDSLAENGMLETAKLELLTALRSKGVKPVRVYIRTVSAVASEIKGSILNVVNTELGGPSMVQLLDAAFYGEDWKEELVSKEAWNGYDFIWRDQVTQKQKPLQQSIAQGKADEPVLKVESDKSGTVEPSVEVVPHQEEKMQSVDVATAETMKPTSPVNKYPESDDEEPEVLPFEHPEWKALREKDLQKGTVQHPTWAREHESQSLLDIITTQSAGMSTTDPISLIATSSTTDNTDDYEVVEKP